MARITLAGLGFRYPGATEDTLRDLDLDIAQGEAHALLGASGAGKTTLLNLLSGLLSPTRGRLEFNGDDVSFMNGRERNVAQVFQFPVLYDGLSVSENLAFPLQVRGTHRKEIAERVDYICAELDITQLRKRKPKGLSLFEKQLVAVGKALVRPDVSMVLLDEPLTAVEPRVKWRLRQTLRKVQADLAVTMIYVTHDQTEALTFADRVSVMAEGRIVQTGTPEDVYLSPEHEFVGHFVGSPGMNFVPSSVLGITHGDRVGFRPEWTSVDNQGSVTGVVESVRTQGTRDGQPYGITFVATEFGRLATRGAISAGPGDRTALRVDRYVVFADQQRVGSSESV